MKYYFEEHGKTGTSTVGGISAEMLARAAQNAGHDEAPATLHFDATHAVVHWRDTEYEAAKKEWNSETEREADLINLMVSSGGLPELQREPHKKWDRSNAVAYVLNARNQSMLLESEVATVFFKMTVEDAENIFLEKLDKINSSLRRLFKHPEVIENLIAISILCQGYLMVCADDNEDVKEARTLLGVGSPPVSYNKNLLIILKSFFTNVFGKRSTAELVEKAEKEWKSLPGKVDFLPVKTIIETAKSDRLEVVNSMVARAFIAIEIKLRGEAVAPNWQIDRGQLNHNWLQNSVLVALNHAIGITAGTVCPRNVCQTLTEDIERWQERHQELPGLLARFENEMSPKNYFDQEPLSNCTEDDRSWLLPVTHNNWLQREKVKEKVGTAMFAYEAATQAYLKLHGALEQLPEAPANEDFGLFQLLLEEFKTACENLSQAISAFPQDIRC